MAKFTILSVVTLLLFLTRETLAFQVQKPFRVLESHPETSALYIPEEARTAIGNVSFPIAVISVIGPYGSGKSFFLNKLLIWSCRKGFKVWGLHNRSRKGVWGAWIKMEVDGVENFVLFLDTDAVEKIENIELYDHRIFAIATVISSVVIYNLPETVQVIDMDRLAFAFELAQKFYGRVKGIDIPSKPAKLLWLIQREFLDGKSVQEVVHDALLNAPNHKGNTKIDMVNRLRDSIALMYLNATAFSLPQPHLDRSRLCDMLTDELDPMYVKKIDQLRELITSVIEPKQIQGRPIHGKDFLSVLDQILEVYNKIQISDSGSLTDEFNNAVEQHCLRLYADRMAGLLLPVLELKVRELHQRSFEEASQCFQDNRLGGSQFTARVFLDLEQETNKLYRYILLENEHRSFTLCERSYSRCFDKMGQIQLPSAREVEYCFQQCQELFWAECLGPAKEHYEQQMMMLLHRSRSLSLAEYNQRVRYILVSVFLVVVLVLSLAALYVRQVRAKSAQQLLPLHRD